MSDVVDLGGGVSFSARAATVETIFEHIRRYAADDVELMQLVAQASYFDRIGGWFFDGLSLNALLRLQCVLRQLEADLPDAIAHWNESRRPIFHANFELFKEKLEVRVEQLRNELG